MLLVSESVDCEVISDIMFRTKQPDSPRLEEAVLGIVQAGLVLPSDIEIMQGSLLDEHDKHNRLVSSKKDYGYKIEDSSRGLLKVQWGRDAEWAPMRESMVAVPTADCVVVRTWPSLSELAEIISASFPNVSEKAFEQEFKGNNELRKFVSSTVPFTKIEISGLVAKETPQMVRLKWKVRDLAYEIPKSNYVYKIFGPKNIWTKLNDKISSLARNDLRDQFDRNYRDTVDRIQAPVYDLEILVNPSLSEFFLHGGEYEDLSRVVTWPFSRPVPAWSHFFSFMPDNQDFFIEMKALSVFPFVERVLVKLNSDSVLSDIRNDQIKELVKREHLSHEEADLFEESINRWIEEELRSRRIESTEEARKLLENLIVYLTNFIIAEL
jgi:hypothetical protein